ncbi:MAG: hypothetical protein IPN46_13955 [Saprospiraceae bacterium]|nr:hypothetical protein [Saprospiraceae bacterium]
MFNTSFVVTLKWSDDIYSVMLISSHFVKSAIIEIISEVTEGISSLLAQANVSMSDVLVIGKGISPLV